MCRAKLLCCFKCMNWFNKEGANSCRSCGDWDCPHCGSCLCDLTLVEKRIAIAYMATYENLLKELTGESYDFSRHGKVLAKIGIEPRNLVGGGLIKRTKLGMPSI